MSGLAWPPTLDQLQRNEQPATIEDIGENTADQAKQRVGEHIRGRHEGDEDRGMCLVDQQLLRAHGLHVATDIADQDGDPESARNTAKRIGAQVETFPAVSAMVTTHSSMRLARVFDITQSDQSTRTLGESS